MAKQIKSVKPIEKIGPNGNIRSVEKINNTSVKIEPTARKNPQSSNHLLNNALGYLTSNKPKQAFLNLFRAIEVDPNTVSSNLEPFIQYLEAQTPGKCRNIRSQMLSFLLEKACPSGFLDDNISPEYLLFMHRLDPAGSYWFSLGGSINLIDYSKIAEQVYKTALFYANLPNPQKVLDLIEVLDKFDPVNSIHYRQKLAAKLYFSSVHKLRFGDANELMRNHFYLDEPSKELFEKTILAAGQLNPSARIRNEFWLAAALNEVAMKYATQYSESIFLDIIYAVSGLADKYDPNPVSSDLRRKDLGDSLINLASECASHSLGDAIYHALEFSKHFPQRSDELREKIIPELNTRVIRLAIQEIELGRSYADQAKILDEFDPAGKEKRGREIGTSIHNMALHHAKNESLFFSRSAEFTSEADLYDPESAAVRHEEIAIILHRRAVESLKSGKVDLARLFHLSANAMSSQSKNQRAQELKSIDPGFKST